MQKSNNALEIHITASTDLVREGFAAHFSKLLEAVSRTDTAGLWQGIAEPDIVLRHVHFGGLEDLGVKVQNILAEMRTYQLTANQYAVLVGVTVAGEQVFYMLENDSDYAECAWNVAHRIASEKVRVENDTLEQAADRSAYEAAVSAGLMVQ